MNFLIKRASDSDWHLLTSFETLEELRAFQQAGEFDLIISFPEDDFGIITVYDHHIE